MLFAASAVAIATPAAAQESSPDKAEAKKHFALGNERLKTADYDGAIVAYQRAHALYPHALIRYNMGLAYDRKGDSIRAIAALKQALTEEPSLSPERERRAQELIDENEKRIARVKIVANMDGVEVLVNGEIVGTTPGVELPVAAGEPVVVAARKKGFMPLSQVVRATGGTTKNLRIELDPAELLPAEVRLDSKLPGAQIYVDGRLVAITPTRSTIAVKPNEPHRIELRRDGYLTAVDTVKLAPGTEGTVSLTPQPDPQHATRAIAVTFDVRPEDASVRIDGALMQDRTVKLMSGPHRVAVERTGYETAVYALEVPPMGSHTVTYALLPTTETRHALIGEAQSVQSWGYGLTIGGSVVAATGLALLIFNGAYYADDVERDRAGFDLGACTIAAGADDTACTDRENAILDREDRVTALWIASPILAVAGLAATTTGIVMLVTGEDPTAFELDGDELGRITVRPGAAIGPTGGYVGVTATF